MQDNAERAAPWIYVTADTGTVHLGIWSSFRTLCGRVLGGMELGDETESGLAVTCGRCRQIVRHNDGT